MASVPVQKQFALIGAAGYIAVRHLKAIKETGNNLLAALDKHDSVGIMDNYFPEADFFVEFERFDRHIDKLRRIGNPVDYVSICSPNYLHDTHIRFALRQQADAICEKPMVLNPWNVDALEVFEEETGHRVYNILQLRLHETIQKLKETFPDVSRGKKHDIDLTYITSRGHWYFFSWKGNLQKSGGIATNIGIHFFDMLIWIFGKIQDNKVFLCEQDKATGFMELENARVRWFLSLDSKDLPDDMKKNGQRTFRSIRIDGKEVEFSSGFTELHTETYRDILRGNGFGIEDVRPSIEATYEIRNAIPVKPGTNELHPFIKSII
ncbi:MAG: Gfo/Idh/MocA family oxidoreductase [Chlorobi bacterium]|nr:Gfo/Idh/MocA family oxidoreductase [Chlorobiota bacterium]